MMGHIDAACVGGLIYIWVCEIWEAIIALIQRHSEIILGVGVWNKNNGGGGGPVCVFLEVQEGTVDSPPLLW